MVGGTSEQDPLVVDPQGCLNRSGPVPPRRQPLRVTLRQPTTGTARLDRAAFWAEADKPDFPSDTTRSVVACQSIPASWRPICIRRWWPNSPTCRARRRTKPGRGSRAALRLVVFRRDGCFPSLRSGGKHHGRRLQCRRRQGNALGGRSRSRGVDRAGIAERSGGERPGLRLSR